VRNKAREGINVWSWFNQDETIESFVENIQSQEETIGNLGRVLSDWLG